MISAAVFSILLALAPQGSNRSLSLDVLEQAPDPPLPGAAVPAAPDPPRPTLVRGFDPPAAPEDPLDPEADNSDFSCGHPGTGPAPPR